MLWAINKEGKRIQAEPNANAKCSYCDEELIPKCGEIKIWHWAHKQNSECDSWYEPETIWHINWKNKFPKDWQEVIIDKYIPSASGDSGGMERHIEDIQTKKGTIIEFQNSSISKEDIEKREEFYQKMVWVINSKTIAKNINLRNKGNYHSFRWKHPPKSWWSAKKPIYVDLNPLAETYLILHNKIERQIIERQNYISEYLKKEKGEKYEKEYYGLYITDDKTLDTLKFRKKFYWNIYDKCKDNLFQIQKIYPNIPCVGYGKIISKEDFYGK